MKFSSYKYWLNEKFTEDSDPIHDLSIGMDALIKRWIENETGYTYNQEDLLWISAQYGKTEFVKYLIDKGYDVHAKDDGALRLASFYGHTETVKVLLDAGADVHTEEDTTLRIASIYGHTETVKVLLDAGADVHARDDWALQMASKKGHTETVKVLLDAGADVHADDDWALRMASEKGHTEVVKVLKDWISKEKKDVNEKFSEDSDPISDMNIGMIGMIENAIKFIFEEDRKHKLTTNTTTEGNIYDINVTNSVKNAYLVGTYFKIHFYSGKMFDDTKFYKNGKPRILNRKQYAIELVEKAGISECFYEVDYAFHRHWIIDFKIKPEYRKYFKPGWYKY